MNMSTKLNYLNPENIIEKFMLSKKNKCKCGKTKDSNGNCDGSHATK